MTPNLDKWSIVIAGQWNPSIFLPPWIGKHLFLAEEFSVEFAVSNPALPPRFSSGGVRLLVDAQRLQLLPTNTSSEALAECAVVAKRALEKLAHTPIQAVGINFGFTETTPDTETLKLFALPDTNPLADADMVSRQTTITRSLSNSDGALNLTIQIIDNGTVSFDFNFHKDTTSTADASAYLDDRASGCLATATRILSTVYGLELVSQE